jgi:hypothetical protein
MLSVRKTLVVRNEAPCLLGSLVFKANDGLLAARPYRTIAPYYGSQVRSDPSAVCMSRRSEGDGSMLQLESELDTVHLLRRAMGTFVWILVRLCPVLADRCFMVYRCGWHLYKTARLLCRHGFIGT